jgi:tungstate transport system ATP-binding protein
METLYRLESIQLSYGNSPVLAVDGLTLFPGRIYIIGGVNGAGKSTLLNLLAFLSPPGAGQLFFAGERVSWNSATLCRLRREVTLLHQSPYLFSGSVGANVGYGLKVRGMRGAVQQRLVDEALEAVGLAGFQGRPARDLSGGEAQRVAMARALALKPRAILLDEPLAHVDRDTTRLLGELIAALPGRGTSVIMSTHDPAQAAHLDGELILLERGRVI